MPLDFPECKRAEATDECRTKTCSYNDSSWSGISECTCDTPETATPPAESPLDTLRKEWTENRRASNDSHSASLNEASFILLTDSRLWHLNHETGRSILLTSFAGYYDAKDFAVWHGKKVCDTYSSFRCIKDMDP